jgi:hypothetical protein
MDFGLNIFPKTPVLKQYYKKALKITRDKWTTETVTVNGAGDRWNDSGKTKYQPTTVNCEPSTNLAV